MAVGIDYPKKECNSLQLLSQVAVVKLLHERALQIDNSYKKWTERTLGACLRATESSTDVRFIDTAQVLSNFHRDVEKTVPSGPQSSSIVTRSRAAANKKAENALKEQKKKFSKQQKRGIPPNVEPEDYILFRKCLYMETIDKIRQYLVSHLPPSVINDLMMTSHNIVLHNHLHEGFVTLTAMLTTRSTSVLLTKCVKNNVVKKKPDEDDDTSLSFTILQRSILHGNNLVHICLYSFCRDFILRSISLHARNLKYLNVTDSKISKDGLFNLCGLEKQNNSGETHGLRVPKPFPGVRTPYRVNALMGCFKLEHFEATHVLTSSMPDLYTLPRDRKNLPENSVFVLMLQKMENLRVFLVSYGGMAVNTLARRFRKRRQQKKLKLQILADDRPCTAHMLTISHLCPDLKEIVFTINQRTAFTGAEDWICMLPSIRVVSLSTKGVSFHSSNFSKMLLQNGSQLTRLDLEAITHFKYSYFKAIKKGCPNLQDFNLVMSGLERAYIRLNLIVDIPIQKPRDEDGKLSKLQSFIVFGPFRSDLIEFMLHGATDMKSLSLGIDYLDPFMCPLQPTSRDDFLGKGYLRKVFSSNKMEKLEELHLHSVSTEGKRQLDKGCAESVLKLFPRLRHLGNFFHWNLSLNERRQLIVNHQKGNRSFLFDDELSSSSLYEESNYVYKCVPGRSQLCCNRITFGRGAYGVISSFFEAFAGDNVFLNFMEEVADDDSDLSDDEDFQLFPNGPVNAPFIPLFEFVGLNEDPLFEEALDADIAPQPMNLAQPDQLLEDPPDFIDEFPDPDPHVALMEVIGHDFHNQCVVM